MTITGVPELVPARMLNEYAYCPRLFFLEWVDQLWAPNSDTAEGDRQHRRVEKLIHTLACLFGRGPDYVDLFE